MRKIDINITKAQIMSFGVLLKEGQPDVHATIGLFTDGGKQVSEYSISTYSWEKDKKFDLPVDLIAPILEIMKSLEKIVVQHCRASQKQLEAPLSAEENNEEIPF